MYTTLINMPRILFFSMLLSTSLFAAQLGLVPAQQMQAHQENVHAQTGIDRKRDIVVKIVNEAATYLASNRLDKACRDFMYSNTWRIGEIFIFVIDANGRVLCHGDDFTILWTQFEKHAVDPTGKSVLKTIRNVPDQGGWVEYIWHRGHKTSFVKKVVKGEMTYYVGSGIFPSSPAIEAQQLVEIAESLFYNKGISELTMQVNNPYGPLVKGEIILSVYDDKGILLADPEKTGFIGQNLMRILGRGSEAGIKTALDFIRSSSGRGWDTYNWKNSTIETYNVRVQDPKTKKIYAISGGYAPHITRQDMIDFVHTAINHIKTVGAKDAFADFNNMAGQFIKGPLAIFVYDYEGKNHADGENPTFVGKNLINRKSLEGAPITQRIIDQAKKYGRGSFSYFDRNSYKTIYFEAIEVPDGKFIIGSGYYPSSKAQKVEAMVNKGAAFLAQESTVKALSNFGDAQGDFFLGDIHLFVYTIGGIALVNGIQNTIIWKNFSQMPDMQGNSIMQEIISLAQSGGGWAQYHARNANRRIYVQMVTKKDPLSQIEQVFIIGSGYYV